MPARISPAGPGGQASMGDARACWRPAATLPKCLHPLPVPGPAGWDSRVEQGGLGSFRKSMPACKPTKPATRPTVCTASHLELMAIHLTGGLAVFWHLSRSAPTALCPSSFAIIPFSSPALPQSRRNVGHVVRRPAQGSSPVCPRSAHRDSSETPELGGPHWTSSLRDVLTAALGQDRKPA